MNTVIKDTFGEGNDIAYEIDNCLMDKVLKSLSRNNTFTPNITRVIYNLNKDKSVLATTVYFIDGTKVTVKNSGKDKVTLCKEKVKLSDGSVEEIETASEESREVGLVYAILKRIICSPDDKGCVNGKGFGSFLKKTVKNAWNQNVEEIKTKRDKDFAKKVYLEKVAKQKPKSKNSSLREVVNNLSEVVKGLAEKMK